MSLTKVLEVNWIILYFVYGQVFFVMGLVTGLQWRRRSRLELARPLPWLAAFGISHGLNEWGDIFIPFQAVYLGDAVVRLMVIAHLLLLATSFFFLMQFGVELVLPALPRQLWLRTVPAVMLCVWAGAVLLRGALAQDPLGTLVAVADGWSRYLLALPGAVLAHLGLIRQARQLRGMGLPRIAIYLTGASLAFAAYAVFGGLVVPTAPVFPATFLNYSLIERTILIPVQVFRSLCGLAMAFSVARFLEVFQVEADRRIEEMERSQLLAADRERIGRDLHDGIVQKIYAAGLGLEDAQLLLAEEPRRAAARIRSVMDALNQTIHDIRRYIFDLRSAEPNLELEAVLQGLVRDLAPDTLLKVDLQVTGQRCCLLSPRQVDHLTQIAREALSNVVQHAGARHVTVGLAYLGTSTRLTVADDGQGMDLALLDNGHNAGQGIANIQARTRLMNANLVLDSGPGRGLRIELTIPCGNGNCPDGLSQEQKQWD